MSDIFKKIGDTITETGKTVGEKTKQVGNAAKMNARIISAEHSISENYTVIGKYYYEKHKNDPDEEIAETVNAVTASIETIAQLKSELLAIKGLVKCQNCGSACPFEDSYCGKCGAVLEKPEPAEEAAEESGEVEETEEIEVISGDTAEVSENIEIKTEE